MNTLGTPHITYIIIVGPTVWVILASTYWFKPTELAQQFEKMWLTEIITLFHISIDYPDTGINVCGGYFSFDQNYLSVLSATRLYVADTTLLHRLFQRLCRYNFVVLGHTGIDTASADTACLH